MKKLILVTITLLISGGISIAQDKWQNTVSGSFGSFGNQKINAMHVFNGKIYAGTANNNGELYSSSTGAANSWTQVFSQSYVQSIDAINSTTQGGGYIYISGYANGSDNPRIYKSGDDGATWTPYYESNYDRLPYVFPFKGTGAVDSIYIVRENYPFSTVLKSAYDSNDPTNSSNTFDTVFVSPSFENIKCYTQYNNRIYAGTNSGKIWISSTDGNTWKQDTLFQPNFGNGNNYGFTAMGSYGGYIYVGTENYSDGAQIWRSNNDSIWTKLNQTFPPGKISSMNVFSGKLWVTFEAAGGSSGQIMKSANGTTFSFSDSTGFGLNQNHGMAGNMVQFGNHIYYSCGNTDTGMPQMPTTKSKPEVSLIYAGQIWRTCTGVLPTVNLGADKIACGGVAVTFDAGAGLSGYLWSTGETTRTVSVNSEGRYDVVVTGSNGCQNVDTVELINKATPQISVTMPEGSATLCKNDTLDIWIAASSDVRDTLAPVHRITNAPISYSLGTTYDTLAINGVNDYISSALVSVTIDSLKHTYDGELVISLRAPDGSYMTLAAYNGGSGQDFTNTVFSNNGADINTSSAPFTGNYTPIDPFGYLSGMADGQWLLIIDDGYGGNDGNLKGWSLKFSKEDTVMTYSWTPATGLLSTNTRNTRAAAIKTTTYGLTVTNSIGCSSTDSVYLIVPELKVAKSSVVACYGSSATISATGGNTYYWSPATGLNTTTGDTVIATPTATAKYYVNDTVAGCAISDSVVVKANPELTASAGASQTVCFADTATFVGLATGGAGGSYTYFWNGGGNNYTTQKIKVTPAAMVSYTLVVTDSGGCNATDNTTLFITPSTDVYGRVDTSGVSITSGKVVIYQYLPYKTHFDTIQVQSLNASGYYHFTNINHGNYLIEVFADTLVYPRSIPTYYGNQSLWNISPSEIVVHDCNVIDTFDITLINMPVLATGGTGTLSGRITKGLGFGKSPKFKGGYSPERSDPIPGVDVKLGKNPGGSAHIVEQTQTDSDGKYSFSHLPLGPEYVIFVDIPGLGRDSSYVVTPTLADSVILYLDYVADSTTIHYVPNAGVGIKKLNAVAQNNFSVYPNPSNGNATVEYVITDDASVTLGIYNVLGVKVCEVVKNDQQAGTYKYNVNVKKNNLSAGVYFITLIVNNKTSVQRFIITE